MTLNIETGTLAELNVKPRDVVQPGESSVIWPNRHYEITEDCLIVDGDGDKWDALPPLKRFRIVSRAYTPGERQAVVERPRASVSPDHAWEPENPKLWRGMTDAEKGALLLAAYEGKTIEVFQNNADPIWTPWVFKSNFADGCAYRVKPEPARDTVVLTGGSENGKSWGFYTGCEANITTHRITFDLVNGEPDLDSIKMEKLYT